MSLPRRGQRLFREPLDARYRSYLFPPLFEASCRRCGGLLKFVPEPRPTREPAVYSEGGWRVLGVHIAGRFAGRGSCVRCSLITSEIDWPAEARYRVRLGGAELWAWNRDYLELLLARLAGGRARERQLRRAGGYRMNGCFQYFLARLPQQVLLKKHRARALREIGRMLAEGAR